jgi:two-component system, OmpR family, flagellar system response regulator FtcR
MIVIVDDRNLVTDAFRSSFDREGIPAAGFSAGDFEGWVEAAASEDVMAINAFLIGQCNRPDLLARVIKRRSAAAVIAMKDHKTLANTLELFAFGVDDVISKPCHVREILARIEAISRRASLERDRAADASAAIRIFRDGRDPIVCDEPLSLPRRELRILEFLVTNQSRRVTKSQIFNSVYGLFDQEIDENVIESHISKLRRRLRSRLGYDPIDSKRHLGYRLVGCAKADQEGGPFDAVAAL